MPDAVRRLYPGTTPAMGCPTTSTARSSIIAVTCWPIQPGASRSSRRWDTICRCPADLAAGAHIATFFDGKDWDAGDTLPDHGMVLHLKPGEQGHFHFQSLAAAFAITPGATLDSTHNVFWFDPETMKPLIDSPGNVAAWRCCGLSQDWAGGAARLAIARGLELFPARQGRVYLLVRRLSALCQDRAASRVQGKCGVAILQDRTGTGTMRPSNGSRRRIRRRSAIPPAAPGRASLPAVRRSPRRPTRSCR